MQVTIETVTPLMASKWLEKNFNNRHVRQDKVNRFVRDINEGRFRLTHQGIAFNCDGSLKDGQHRLMAIAKSGKSVDMVVTRGLPDNAVMYVDRGSSRGIHDNARMAGFDITLADVAVAYVAITAPASIAQTSKVTEEEVVDFINKRQDAFAFIHKPKKKLLTNAATMAAFVRAWFHVSHVDLERCITLFLHGDDQDYNPATECAIIRLRELLLQFKGGQSYAIKLEVYRRTQRAIKAFVEREPLKLVKPTDEDFFPLTLI